MLFSEESLRSFACAHISILPPRGFSSCLPVVCHQRHVLWIGQNRPRHTSHSFNLWWYNISDEPSLILSNSLFKFSVDYSWLPRSPEILQNESRWLVFYWNSATPRDDNGNRSTATDTPRPGPQYVAWVPSTRYLPPPRSLSSPLPPRMGTAERKMWYNIVYGTIPWSALHAQRQRSLNYVIVDKLAVLYLLLILFLRIKSCLCARGLPQISHKIWSLKKGSKLDWYSISLYARV